MDYLINHFEFENTTVSLKKPKKIRIRNSLTNNRNRYWFLKGLHTGSKRHIISALIMSPILQTYTRLHKCNHPISKALQCLAWKAKVWTGQGWSHILLCWGRFSYIPWLLVCQFSRKNLPWNVWEKVTNFSL